MEIGEKGNGRFVGDGWCEGITREVSEQGKKVAALEVTVGQLDHAVNGNGQAGIATTLTDFRAEWRTTQVLQAQDATRRDRKNNLIISAFTLVVLALTTVESFHMTGCLGQHVAVQQQSTTQSQPQDSGVGTPEAHHDGR